MKIGIDISQLAYKDTGVANYLSHLVRELLKNDQKNEYILFTSSLRGSFGRYTEEFTGINKNVRVKTYKLPPKILDLLWNRLHILPIELFIGNVDVFISSDWTQPPVQSAKNITILYDLIVIKHPDEMDARIIATQKRKLRWVKKECDAVLCISDATKKDAMELLKIDESKLHVVYPGMTL